MSTNEHSVAVATIVASRTSTVSPRAAARFSGPTRHRVHPERSPGIGRYQRRLRHSE